MSAVADSPRVAASGSGRFAAALPRRLLALVIGLEMVAWFAIVNRGGWAYDDNLWLELARQRGFSDWIKSNLFGHWAVAYNGTFSVLLHLMPFDYRWVLLALLIAVGLSAFLFERIVEMLVGGRWVPLLAAAYLAISVLLIRSLEWFAAGLQTVPTVLFDLLCLWAYLRYQREPSARWIAVSAGAIGIGVLFYEKPVFMPFYILLLRALFLTGSLRPREIAKGIWRERAIWFAYIAVVAVYAIVREAVGAGSIASGGTPTFGQWAEMYWLMWAKSLVPAMFGLALPTPTVSSMQLIVGIALQVVIILGVIVSLVRDRGAWRAWVVLAIVFVVIGLIVGEARVRDFGPQVATDQRYLIDFVWLVPLLICIAFAPQRIRSFAASSAATRADRSSSQPPATSGTLGRAAPRRPWVPVVVAVLALGYVGASIATAANWQDGWQGNNSRTWEQNVQSGLTAVHRTGANAVIADNITPPFIVQSSFAPFNTLQFVLPHFGPPVHVGGPLGGPLYVVQDDGRLHRAVIAHVAATINVGPQCSARSAAGFDLVRRIPVKLDPNAEPYYARFTYTSGGIAHLPLYIDNGNGYGIVPDVRLDIDRGSRQSIAWLGTGSGAGPPRAIHMFGPGYVCVRTIDVVTLAPSG